MPTISAISFQLLDFNRVTNSPWFEVRYLATMHGRFGSKAAAQVRLDISI
jgi:hypothetical protein